MDEGVDPKDMCKGLMEKMAQSELLMAVADHDILVLFEDWLEELENEVIAFAKRTVAMTAEDLSQELGLSSAGARFLIAKLERDGKI